MLVEQYHNICREDSTLRDYQQEAKQAIFEAWDRVSSVMFQMPTGTGKTRLFTSIINDINKYSVATKQPVKIIVIAHRTELIDQIDEHLSRYSIPHGIIAGGTERNLKMPVQVASIQTLTNKRNEADAKKLKADFLIIDEAHHSLARTYKSLWDLYPLAKRLGVTATPWRMSGSGFTDLFDELIMSWTVKKYIDEGFLSNYNYYSLKQSSDISRKIQTIDEFDIEGDYKVSALERTMNTGEIRAQLLDAYLTLAEGKKGIIYAISQEHSKKICEEYKARGISVATIDSKTPKKERKQIVNDFRKGLITIIVNVDIFSEGFDCPDIEFVQLARPTCSLAKYLQQVGRALRPTPQKTHAIILDNVGMYQRFGLPDARRHWKHHFIGSNNSTEEIQKAILRLGDGAGRVFNLKEGHEDMVLIQQTSDVLGVEEDVQVSKEFKLGPIKYESGFVWYAPKHKFDNGIHYYEDMYGRKFCMYADENSAWHFERIISTNPIVRRGLISIRMNYSFSLYCNIARICGTYISYVGLSNDKRDKSLKLLDFWNPIATKDEERRIYFNSFGDEFDAEEAHSFIIDEIENEDEQFDSPRAKELHDLLFNSIAGTGDDLEGLPVALLTYKVASYPDNTCIKACLSDGTEKRVLNCIKGTDFSNTIELCEEKDIPYYVVGMVDRHIHGKKNKWLLFTETALDKDEYLLQFDDDGNFYDEQKSHLNPPQPSKKKNKPIANKQEQIKWNNRDDDELLKLFVKHTNSVPIVAKVMGFPEHTIEVRLYQLIGRPYDGMPQETKSERIVSETRRGNWKQQKKKIQKQINQEFYEEKEEKRRQAEAHLKRNGLYKPGVQFKHPVWGDVTVIKDNENMTKFLLADGTKKTVRK